LLLFFWRPSVRKKKKKEKKERKGPTHTLFLSALQLYSTITTQKREKKKREKKKKEKKKERGKRKSREFAGEISFTRTYCSYGRRIVAIEGKKGGKKKKKKRGKKKKGRSGSKRNNLASNISLAI